MDIPWHFYAIAAVGLLAAIGIGLKRDYRNIDALLRPIVRDYGLTLVSSKSPGPFRTGPFPKFHWRFMTVQTEIFGIRGEYWTYRIVRVRAEDGKTYTVWARLYFQAFWLKEVEWLPPLNTLGRNLTESCS